MTISPPAGGHLGCNRERPGHAPARNWPAALAMASLVLVALLPVACLHKEREPYRPVRPWLRPDLAQAGRVGAGQLFPERDLLGTRPETPPALLARIEEIFRPISLLPGPEPAWRLEPIYAEIDSIEAAYRRIEIGPGGLLRHRLGESTPEDADRIRQAARLELRHGLALMRTGETTRRVWGRERLQRAAAWMPDDPVPLLVLAAAQELGGMWSNEIDLLQSWLREQGHHDAVALQLLRKHERMWIVHRDRLHLDRALEVAGDLARRHAGWPQAPSWLLLERGRLMLQADSLSAAAAAAMESLPPASGAVVDTMSAAQAELILGIVSVRRLEYERADRHFRRAKELAAAHPALSTLASWMEVPWDLWTREQRRDFDREPDAVRWIDRYWRSLDPILATPETLENRIEYQRRVGEAWLLLRGVDPGLPGPLTDPGQVFLRFGRPDEWISSGGQPAYGTNDPLRQFDIHRTWRFHYHLPTADRTTEMVVAFQDHGSEARFTAVDSLSGPRFPPSLFHYGFDGKGYRYAAAPARLRRPDGGIRLLLAYDTFLPEYSVRYPMQGLRYEGVVEARTAVYRAQSRSHWPVVAETGTLLDRESATSLEYTFRRRAGWSLIDRIEAGNVRLASTLTLRDTTGAIVAFAVQNGEPASLAPFEQDRLDASDLILLAPLPDSLPESRDRVLRPGLVAHGPDLFDGGLEPRASRHFLPGEELAYFLEVYNVDTRQGVTEVELMTSLERLDDAGLTEYAVSMRGLSQTLIRFGVNQWNLVRSMGLSGLEPGRYRLRVTVFDRRGSQRLERRADFRLTEPQDLVEWYGWDRLARPYREAPGRARAGGAPPRTGSLQLEWNEPAGGDAHSLRQAIDLEQIGAGRGQAVDPAGIDAR